MLESDLLICLECLAHSLLKVAQVAIEYKVNTYLEVWVDVCDPILLVTILHHLELTPVVSHHLLVVVRDERFEDLGFSGVARVDLGE